MVIFTSSLRRSDISDDLTGLVNLVINKICGLIMYAGSEILDTDLRAYNLSLGSLKFRVNFCVQL